MRFPRLMSSFIQGNGSIQRVTLKVLVIFNQNFPFLRKHPLHAAKPNRGRGRTFNAHTSTKHQTKMKSKKKIRRERRQRLTCCAKLIDGTVQYVDQSGKIQRILLKKDTLSEARQVMRRLVPNTTWII